MNELTKHKVKLKKQQDREFKKLYKKAVKTIRRLKETKKTKEYLIKDLLCCDNIDIMHYLGVVTPSNKIEYLFVLNKWLEIESIEYEYTEKLVYEPLANGRVTVIEGLKCYLGGFGDITEAIRNHHKYLDLKEKIFNISEG